MVSGFFYHIVLVSQTINCSQKINNKYRKHPCHTNDYCHNQCVVDVGIVYQFADRIILSKHLRYFIIHTVELYWWCGGYLGCYKKVITDRGDRVIDVRYQCLRQNTITYLPKLAIAIPIIRSNSGRDGSPLQPGSHHVVRFM